MLHAKRNLGNRFILYSYVAGFAILLFLVIYYWSAIAALIKSPEAVKEYIDGFGPYGVLVFILLQILQVVILFIPGAIFTLAGGYIYGIYLGMLYSMIGTLLGSILVFYMSRLLGRPFVEKVVHRKELQHFDVYFRKKGKLAIVLTRAMPILFPNDAVSFAAGLTSIRTRDYIFYSFLGFIPHLLLYTLLGAGVGLNSSKVNTIILVILVLATIIYIFRHAFKIFLIKEIRDFEADAKKIGQESEYDLVVAYNIIREDVGRIFGKEKGKKDFSK
jgi:uncharacterized membrane protein YdjX (TVP38/TMEM64 family)